MLKVIVYMAAGWILLVFVTNSFLIPTIIVAFFFIIAIAMAASSANEEAEYKQKLATASKDNPILKVRIDNMSGEKFEQYCAELLYAVGYRNIQTTPASGDNGLDVIASANGKTYGIQCKRFSSSVGVKAVQEAFAGALYYNCDVAVVMTNSHFTKAAINMADNIGVELWDRDYIEGLKKQIVNRSSAGHSHVEKDKKSKTGSENSNEREFSSQSKGQVDTKKTNKDESVVEYVKPEEVNKVFVKPNKYIGKHISIPGQVFNVFREGTTVGIQAWHDITNTADNFIAYIEGDYSFDEYEIIIVDGTVEGVFYGENAFGGVVSSVQIKADSIKKSSYAEAIAPAVETRDVNKEVTEFGVTLTVSKVEFAERETRLYVEVQNNSNYTINVFTNYARIVQNGKQYDADYNWKARYPAIDRVSSNASKAGIICVEAMEPQKSITLHIDANTDNWEIDLKELVITF